MANIYCQISGSKRMILFPPSDVTRLSFAPGASSSSLDVLGALSSPAMMLTHPHEATLSPGDVLFIPRMWPHAAAPTTDSSVAVNVFFRDLVAGYSAGRDVYGNRDLVVYEKGRQSIGRVAANLATLPRDVRDFYAKRLASELLDAALV
jgi:tRNA wybutosine-synthesizing protein 4